MNCLSSFHDNKLFNKLFKHYVDFHNIKTTSYLLKTLFETDDKSIFKRKCNICDEIFHTEREIKNHNFLKHFQIGGSQDKPLNVLKRQGFIIYSINFEQHNADYDFYNSEKIVDELLEAVDKKFMVGDQVEVQCAFSLTLKKFFHTIF